MGGTAQHDVVVVGLGVVGAAALWQLAEQGHDVLGIEQFRPGHDRGSSHGATRIFRRVDTGAPHLVPFAARADELWDELQRVSGTPLRLTTGGLTIGTAGGSYLAAAIGAAERGGLPHELLDADALRRRFPQHSVADDEAAVLEPGAGVLLAERAVTAMVDRAVRLGAEVRTDEAVLRVTDDRDGVRVETATGVVRARRAVLAPGAWVGTVLPQLALPIRAQRSIPVLHRPVAGTRGWDAGSFPVFRRSTGGLSGWGVPDVDGSGVKIGVSGAPKPYLRQPEDNRVPAGPDDLELVARFTREAFPGLVGSAVSAQPCLNANTPDGEFVIGVPHRLPHVVLLTGMGGSGFKHAPSVGEIAAQLVAGRTPKLPIDACLPDRFGPDPWRTPFSPVFAPTAAGD